MPKKAVVRFQPLQTCLVNLPLSIYGQLVSRSVTPQSLVVCLSSTGARASGATPPPAHSPSDRKGKSSTKDANNRVYVGWSGMPSRIIGGLAGISKGEEAVEVDPTCARELGLVEGQEVTIDLLRNLPAAATVNVEPVNADDWEIIELHAEFVEQNLLSQVRAASPEHIVCVWVGKSKTLVRFRVESVEPADDIAVRLTVDTEVVVAPKTRYSASSKGEKERHDIGASSSSSSKQAATTSSSSSSSHPSAGQSSPEAERARRLLLRILPETVDIPALHALECFANEESIVYVHPNHYNALAQAFPSTKVSIKIKQCPSLVTKKTRGPHGQQQQHDDHAPATPGQQHQQQQHNRSRTKQGDREAGETTASRTSTATATACAIAHFRPSPSVPKGSIWLGKHTRASLEVNDNAYDLVKLSAASSSQKTSAPALNGINGAHSATLPSTTPGRDAETAQQPEEDIEPCTPFVGMQKHLEKCSEHIRNTLTASRGLYPHVQSSLQPTSAILVSGASGSGKSSLVERLASDATKDPHILAHVQYVNCTPLVNLRIPQLQAKFEEIFTIAGWHAPSLVIIDDLDRLMPAEMEHVDSFRSLHISNLFLNIANTAMRERGIVVVATSKGPEALHAALTSSHFFGERVNLSAPDKNARREIFEALVKAKSAGGEEGLKLSTDFNFVAVATQTDGYLPVDLKDLVDRSVHQAAIRSGKEGASDMQLSLKDVTAAQQDFTPLSLRDVKLQKSEVQWSDIGGLQETRRTLRETLEWPTKYAAIFASSPLRLRSGLLLYGFPGCGKTLLASAVAKECGLNFISVKGPEILNKYIGASEKSVRDLFERAQAARPCVLFFDEFDSIAPKRGHDSTGVTDRVVNQMLTQMDGAEGLEGVYVLAATSRPDLIDPALLRPGRLDKSLLCDMPNRQDRFEIMQACSRKIAMSPEVDLEDYLDETEGYSGADLQAVIYNAHLECIHSSISADKAKAHGNGGVDGKNDGAAPEEENEIEFISFGGPHQNGVNGRVQSRAERAKITKRLEQIMSSLSGTTTKKSTDAVAVEKKKAMVEPHHIAQSLKSTRPSVPKEEIVRLQKIYSEFVSARAKGGLPDGSASQEIGGRSSLM